MDANKSEEFPVYVWAKIDGPGSDVNLRDMTGADIADTPRGTRLTALGRDPEGRLILDARIAEYVTQRTDPGPYREPTWLWPVGDTPEVDCIVTDEFWTDRGNGYRHEGLDLRARNQRPILAVADGIIARASLWDGTKVRWDAYGHHVVLMIAGTDYSMLFAHLSALRVVTGQRVKRGDVLGLSGSTGNSYAAHLHVTCCHPSGIPAVFGQLVVDPLPLFPPVGQRSNLG